MNSEELRAYKRDKSKKFNAHLRDLRLRDKENKQTADQQGNTIDKQDELSLQDVMDIFETLDTKLEIIETKLVTKLENKLYELLDKLDIMENKLETIIENKLYEPLENNQPIKQQPSIFFA